VPEFARYAASTETSLFVIAKRRPSMSAWQAWRVCGTKYKQTRTTLASFVL
jgi:hypothetical protein